VPALLAKARALGLHVEGVSYHVGSGNGDAASFGAAVRDAKAVFDMGAAAGYTMTLLDLGGGYPGSTLGVDLAAASPPSTAASGNPYASHPTFRTIATHIRSALDTHFPVGCGVEIIGEPGRFFVKSTMTLAVCVVGKRRTVNEEDGGGAVTALTHLQQQQPRLNYYVNDGLYGSFNCNVYDHAQPTPSFSISPKTLAYRSLDPEVLHLLEKNSTTTTTTTTTVNSDTLAFMTSDGQARHLDALGLPAAEALQAAGQTPAFTATSMGISRVVERRLVMGGFGEEEEEGGGGGAAASMGTVGGAGGGVGGAALLTFTSSSSSGRAGARYTPSTTYNNKDTAINHQPKKNTTSSSSSEHTLYPTTLWGPTCDSFDKLSDTLRLPELANGDWIVYENMGAYTIAGACK